MTANAPGHSFRGRTVRSIAATIAAAAAIGLTATACDNGSANGNNAGADTSSSSPSADASRTARQTGGKPGNHGANAHQGVNGGEAAGPVKNHNGGNGANGGTGAAKQTPGASAAPAGPGSSCRPANHRTTIKGDEPSAGHRHYRVTLTAAPGYGNCTLAGSPTGVAFSSHGQRVLAAAGSYGPQGTRVTFGPGHPVHFDIQVPNQRTGSPVDDTQFTLQGNGAEIPGSQDVEGSINVDDGTLIGAVQPGA